MTTRKQLEKAIPGISTELTKIGAHQYLNVTHTKSNGLIINSAYLDCSVKECVQILYNEFKSIDWTVSEKEIIKNDAARKAAHEARHKIVNFRELNA